MTNHPDSPSDLSPETVCAHWGEDPAEYFGAAVPPIYQTSLFTGPSTSERFTGAHGKNAYSYSRVSNPTTGIVEAKLAALEGGEAARCFGSGMAAISGAILSCVRAGDHVIAVDTAYGPTRGFLTDFAARFGVDTTFVEGSDPAEIRRAIRTETRLIYLESPSSGVMKQQDLGAVAAVAKEHGIATICDNSWASPVFQNPLAFGIDLVVHSATKYLGGHSDIVAGAAIGNGDCINRLRQNEAPSLGGMLDPFAAWLLLRGLRTLPIRMERHHQSARSIGLWLQQHPFVAHVYYPGLPGDPQPRLTERQLRGTSGLLSFRLHRSDRDTTCGVIDRLRWFGIGCSWGGFESLAIPMLLPPDATGAAEGEYIIRLHIGLEGVEDLRADLDQALTGAHAGAPASHDREFARL
ncbi:MAG: PLP-dependent transferase [Armatimonadetes bacterium]|nr:PLP-dependent transferase [Armatimonadota bacterium]MDE2207543.1 PLP-dependent transferase [Armatimonadota bacterium]